MISDVLADAIVSIDSYLDNPAYAEVYSGDLRKRIIKLRNDMATVQAELDTPPGVSVSQKPLRTEVSKVGISITVLDESPTTVNFGLMDDWKQSFNLDETDKALLAEVSEKHFSLYKGEFMVNATLIDMARAVDVFMREHYPQRYTGHVRLRRGRKVDDEYRYTYISYE